MYFTEPKIDELLNTASVVVFDMNGTIIDDELIQLQAVNIALSPFHYKIDEVYWGENCVGRRAEEFITTFFEKKLNAPLPQLKRIIESKEQAYETLLRKNLPSILQKGAIDLLKHLNNHPNKKKLALATSSSRNNVDILLSVNSFTSKSSFDLIICGDNLAKAKPDPEIYLKVRNFFKEESSFLVFEDSGFGVLAAKLAGLRCIAIPNRFTVHQNFVIADLVISDLSRHAHIIGSKYRSTHK